MTSSTIPAPRPPVSETERYHVLGLLRAAVARDGHPHCSVDLELYDEDTFLAWLKLGKFEEPAPIPRGLDARGYEYEARAAFARLAMQIVRACGSRLWERDAA